MIDKAILNILRENSKVYHKSIGNKLFLTGQSVGKYISKIDKYDIIQQCTIFTNNIICDKHIYAYVTVFMKNWSVLRKLDM